MYAFNKLCRKSQDYLYTLAGSGRGRSDAFSFAIASVLVGALTIEKPGELAFFEGEHKEMLLKNFNYLNEVVSLDIDKIFYYGKKLLDYRVNQIKGQQYPNVITTSDMYVLDFFGLTKVFSQEDFKLITENGYQITADMLELQSIFAGLGVL